MKMAWIEKEIEKLNKEIQERLEEIEEDKKREWQRPTLIALIEEEIEERKQKIETLKKYRKTID